jgi:hypothetical protein
VQYSKEQRAVLKGGIGESGVERDCSVFVAAFCCAEKIEDRG